MKSLSLFLSLLVFASACNVRPKRPDGMHKTGSALPDPNNPGQGEQNPGFVDSNDPLDSYLSVGPYLQKEFDTAESAGKVVKVYLQVRQENSVEKNYASLKELMGSVNASIPSALDAAQKKGDSTVEFEADVASLKTSVTMINKAASGIEISLPTVK